MTQLYIYMSCADVLARRTSVVNVGWPFMLRLHGPLRAPEYDELCNLQSNG